jgi:exosortase
MAEALTNADGKVADATEKGGSLIDDALGYVKKGQTWVAQGGLQRLASHSLFVPVLAGIVGLVLMYFPFLRQVLNQWISDDYYSHGFLVPILVIWQLNVRKDLFAKSEPKGSNIPFFLFIPVLFLQIAAYTGEYWFLHSVTFVASLLLATWAIFGWKWAKLCILPFGFLLFAFPIWGSVIDNYTNPLQLLSTSVAKMLLTLFGFNPMQLAPTEIQLNSFTLNVAVPCSGLKLLVAVSCFTCHLILVARGGFSFNMLMFILVLPLCLFINGLRIALIGVVGDQFGSDAGLAFHDYSGYITLLLCFFILFKFARLFGWKG